MRIGSLFSGIGGLELGLEWAGVGHTVFQVETDEYCQRVLSRHWPLVERFENVEDVGSHNLPPVDLLCGGFPCQDLSVAGRQAGLDGSRSGLWKEFLRIATETSPRWIVVENVGNGAKNWVPVVQRDLERAGYRSLPIPLEARYVGAPHRRARVFVVAYSERVQLREQPRRRCGPGRQGPTLAMESRESARWDAMPQLCRSDDGLSRGLDRARIKALGNAVVPQVSEIIGHVILQLEKDLKT